MRNKDIKSMVRFNMEAIPKPHMHKIEVAPITP